MSRRQGKEIEVSVRGDVAPSIVGDVAALRSVLTNLIINAVDAIAGPGHIVVRIAGDSQSASIEVIDDGPGMPPEQVAQIFEVGFDNKSERVRMKLGLVMDYNIIRQNAKSNSSWCC